MSGNAANLSGLTSWMRCIYAHTCFGEGDLLKDVIILGSLEKPTSMMSAGVYSMCVGSGEADMEGINRD